MKYLKKLGYIIIAILAYLGLLKLLVYFETSAGGSIDSLGNAVWYSIVTLSTVGYGDMFPVSVYGRILGVVFLIGSVSILGTVVGSISSKINNHLEKRKMGMNGTNFENHIVIVGWNTFVKRIIKILIGSGRRVALICDNNETILNAKDMFPTNDLFTLQSDYDNIELFTKANIEKSRIVYVMLEDDTRNLVSILNMKSIYPDVNFIVILENDNLNETFKAAGVSYIVSKNDIASKLMASYLFEPDVAEFNLDLLSDAKSKDDFDMQQFKIVAGNQFLNKPYKELFDFFRANHRILPVGISKKAGNEHNLIKLPPDETLIELDDYVLFINDLSGYGVIKDIFKVEQGV